MWLVEREHMDRRSWGFLVLATILGGCSCLNHHHHNQLLVINVLDPYLYEDCHIKNSINVPFEQLEAFAKELDRNTQLVLYCSNYLCTASIFGARLLRKMGFKNVWAYEGGMAEWHQKKMPIEGLAQQSYLTMQTKPVADDGAEKDLVITAQELEQKMMALMCGTCTSCG